MSTVINKFLLIGPWSSHLSEIGSTIVKDLYEANYHFERNSYEVIGINLTSLLEKRFIEYYKKWTDINPNLQMVLVIPKDFSSEALFNLYNQYHFVKVFFDYNSTEIEHHLYLALEKVYQLKQIDALKILLKEQNENLSKWNQHLEEKIEKRTKFLIDSRRKLFITNFRIESFRKALTVIHSTYDINELETNLNQELLKTFEIQWIKILYHPDDHHFQKEIDSKLDYLFLRFSLFRNNDSIGSIFFMRSKTKPFVKEESEFLNRITEAVSLSLERIEKFKKMETIQNHWNTTFTTIKEPVALITEQYEILQTNFMNNKPISKFENNKLGYSFSGKKCFELLFNKKEPCHGCQLNSNFKIKIENSNYEVFSQNVSIERKNYFVNYYSNINEKLKLEATSLIQAPEIELGIVSSSIAHEINNPLSGLLSFTQLLKMDTPPDDTIYKDLISIEEGVRKCRDIVDNLLTFSRKADLNNLSALSLTSTIDKALRLYQIQNKNTADVLEIQIKDPKTKANSSSKEIYIMGQALILVQLFLDMFIIIGQPLKPRSQKIIFEIHNEYSATLSKLTIKNIEMAEKTEFEELLSHLKLEFSNKEDINIFFPRS